MICKGSTYYIVFDVNGKEAAAELTAVSDDSDLWEDVYATSPALYDFLDTDKVICITEDRPAKVLDIEEHLTIECIEELM